MHIDRSGIITIAIIILVILAVAVFAYMRTLGGGEQGSEASRVLSESEESTAFTDLNGEPITLDAYEGRVRVVNAWASWCPFCVQELPDLAELAAEYRDEDVAVIAINRKESPATAQSFLDSLDASTEGVIFVMDPNDTFYRSIGGFTMPETVFYDANGDISFHKRGFMDLAEMRQRTEAALAASGSDE